MTIDQQIESLINDAIGQNIVRYNRHGLGGFEIAADQLPQDITFDRLGLYDATLLNGNGCAQLRKRKRGPITITFSIEPEIVAE